MPGYRGAMTFTQWLAGQQAREDEVGDLASDLAPWLDAIPPDTLGVQLAALAHLLEREAPDIAAEVQAGPLLAAREEYAAHAVTSNAAAATAKIRQERNLARRWEQPERSRSSCHHRTQPIGNLVGQLFNGRRGRGDVEDVRRGATGRTLPRRHDGCRDQVGHQGPAIRVGQQQLS